MRLFRLIVVLATLVSLPGYGLAATGHAGPCPERVGGGTPSAAHHVDMTGMDMAGMAGMDGAPMPHECCPGTANPKPATPHAGCPACIAAHDCKSPQGAQTLAVLVRVLLPRQAAVPDAPSRHVSLCGPDGLLRPPNLS